MTSDSETTDEAAGSGEGLIDVEGGYTQQEQMAELGAVVEVMREHFGEDVATIDGEPWTAQRHDAEVAARPQGDDVYRHVINFNVELTDLEATYATAEEIAEELGLSENLNNSNGITRYDKIFYGAGRDEGRIVLIASTTSGDGFRASYTTRRSDHDTIIAAYDRIIEGNRADFRQEYGSDDL